MICFFEAATLKSFGKAKEIQTGMIAVLHTWDRTCPYTRTYTASYQAAGLIK
jgi:hypothetical protein